MSVPVIWRLNIKPKSENGVNPREFCITKKFLGVGWAIKDLPEDWDAYYKKALLAGYGKYKSFNRAINAMRDMKIGDLCWTRMQDGTYYLARITGDLRYCSDDGHVEADIVNIRSCHWVEVGAVDAVPGKVVNSFIPSGTIQRVCDEAVSIYSRYCYNKISGEPFYNFTVHEENKNIFSLLSSEDCEDLVALYMQKLGYVLFPSTCKKSTQHVEFVMRNIDTGEVAFAQVKNGDVNLSVNDYKNQEGRVFLFTTKGSYSGYLENVECIDPQVILDFMNENKKILPDRIQNWMDFLENI